MSDINQISTSTIEEILSLNDDLKNISISNGNSCMHDNDSDYEDLDDDDEFVDTTILTSILDKNLLKETIDEDRLDKHIKPRTRRINHENDNHSESDEDHQNVPKIKVDIKSLNNVKQTLDDDFNTQSPAYIPRKGKFYEHDDRTLNDNVHTKQEISRNIMRLSKGFEGKWEHDLYFEDERKFNSRYSSSKQNHHYSKHNNRKQFLLNDYIFQSQNNHINYHRPIIEKVKKNISFNRINNFDTNRYSSNFRKKTQEISYQQQRNDYFNPIDEQIFHRRRYFTNNQLLVHDNLSKRNYSRDINRPSQENNQFRDNNNRQYNGKSNKYEVSEKTRNLPLRFPENRSNTERSKRYSHMRNNLNNPIQVERISSSQIKHQDQRLTTFESNNWPQTSSLSTTFLSKQLITPQMYYQQTTSRYVTLKNSTPSISEQVYTFIDIL